MEKSRKRIERLLPQLDAGAKDECFGKTNSQAAGLRLCYARNSTDDRDADEIAVVEIGGVSTVVRKLPTDLATLVPCGYLNVESESQQVLQDLRFLIQKDALAQDTYLIGAPGSLRRDTVFKFCELTNRPLEYVCLSQDTTESDLKQRREIEGGTARYVDCAAVRAAVNGSILLLDGVEKTERNVLPLLNNLLENREMALEDGKFLMNSERYDSLRLQHSDQKLQEWNLIRTSDKFRVIALGVPTPIYPGNPLDPPFRSRFQARDVSSLSATEQLRYIKLCMTEHTADSVPRHVVQTAAVLHELRHSDGASHFGALPDFPQGYEKSIGKLLGSFPYISPRCLTDFVYPYPFLMKHVTDEREALMLKVFNRFSLFAREVCLPNRITEQDVNLKSIKKNDSQLDENEVTDAFVGIPLFSYVVKSLSRSTENSFHANLRFRIEPLNAYALEFLRSVSFGDVSLILPSGTLSSPSAQFLKSADIVQTSSFMRNFSKMVQAHSVGDFMIFGEQGGGKSTLVKYFAKRFGYEVEYLHLYKDIMSRGLLQRRVTHENGDTDWEDSPLVVAAKTGRIAVLDGVEQTVPGTLAILQLLIMHREVRLPNGGRLIAVGTFDQICKRQKISPADLKSQGVWPIHPSFRVIATARPRGSARNSSLTGSWKDWFESEIQSMFTFVCVEPFEPFELMSILRTQCPRVSVSELYRLVNFANTLKARIAEDDLLNSLYSVVSLRNLIRICKRCSLQNSSIAYFEHEGVYADSEMSKRESGALFEAILSAALARFLPPLVLDTLLQILKSTEIRASSSEQDRTLKAMKIERRCTASKKNWPGNQIEGTLVIGDMQAGIVPTQDVAFIPDILFYDNPKHTLILRDVLRDWVAGQHILLIGNQGVGKNKIADRFLQLMQLPREYIQLHRDTTVQNLTSNPIIVDGVLRFEDSPLVRAAREGRVLVVDEADKAPTHVTAILKSLVEDGNMLLGDGRRIVSDKEIIDERRLENSKLINGFHQRNHIPLHPNFRVIALANRPGFPFHGNDFFREVGDVFASHAIDNPDFESEKLLLQQFGPNVPEETLKKLVFAFDELRSMSDDGQLNYPYSTRELTNIVRHLQAFPNDGIDRTLRNVFDFDTHGRDISDLLMKVFTKNGVPFSVGSSFRVQTGATRDLLPPMLLERWSLTSESNSLRTWTEKSWDQPVFCKSLISVLRKNLDTHSFAWSLNAPRLSTKLNVVQRAGTIFSEEQFNFELPQGVILGLAKTMDGDLVLAARSHSLMLFHVDSGFENCVVFDLHSSMPTDGLYRLSPKSVTLLPLSGYTTTFLDNPFKLDVAVLNPTNGNIVVVDLHARQFFYVESLPGYSQGLRMRCSQGPTLDTLMVYQRGASWFTLLDLRQNRIHSSCLSDDVSPLLPFTVDRVFSMDDGKWFFTPHSSPSFPFPETIPFVAMFTRDGNSLRFLSIERREHTEDGELVSTVPCYLSGSVMQHPPGAFRSAGYDARMICLFDEKIGDYIPALATNMPKSILDGSYCHVYAIDSQGSLQNKSHFAETEHDTVVKEELRLLKKREEPKLVHCNYLEGDLLVVAKEHPEKMCANIEIFDIPNGLVRTLSIAVGSGLFSDNTELSLYDSGAKQPEIPSVYGNVRQSPNLDSFRRIISPTQANQMEMRRKIVIEADKCLFITPLSNETMLTVDVLGMARVWLVDDLAIRRSFQNWRQLVGNVDDEPLKVRTKRINGEHYSSNPDNQSEGKGEGDGTGEGEGKGDGTGEGEGDGEGTGKGRGDGSNGFASQKSGKYTGKAKGKRFKDISDLPNPSSSEFRHIEIESHRQGRKLAEDNLGSSLSELTSNLKKEEFLKALSSIDMSEDQMGAYARYKEVVKTESRELRVTLAGLEANESERTWTKYQSSGDLDDSRLIDGLTGERNIYKRRKDRQPDAFSFQPKPKLLHFVFDLSMSMGRYAADGRLQRTLEAATMIMEAMKGFEHKFEVRFTGHSGDSDEVQLGVEFGKPPRNDHDRLKVLKRMNAHIQMCDSGDRTVAAIKRAILGLASREADDRYIFALSDANLDQYGITTAHFQELSEAAKKNNINLFVLFIATIGDQAEAFQESQPGRIFACFEKSDIPRTLKSMFLSSISPKL